MTSSVLWNNETNFIIMVWQNIMTKDIGNANYKVQSPEAFQKHDIHFLKQ